MAVEDWIATVRLDAEMLRRYGFADSRGAPVFALVESAEGDNVAGVPMQADTEGDSVTLRFLLRGATPKGAVRVFRFVKSDRSAAAPEFQPVTVEREADRIRIRTQCFEIVHDLGRGGLISSVRFVSSGKVWRPLMRDRLYRKGLGVFALAADRAARLLSRTSGPLAAELVFQARYTATDGRPCPSGAMAVYRYRYCATLPYVEIETDIRQEKRMPWDELHVLELTTKGPFFQRFAMGPPFMSEELIDVRRAHSLRGKLWGALFNSRDAVALFGGPLYGIYDGVGGYGVYVHGPWRPWAGEEASFKLSLYLGPSGGDGRRIEGMIQRRFKGIEVSVRVPAFERRARLLRERLAAVPASGVAEGLIAAALRTSRSGGNSAQAEAELAAARRVAGDAAARKGLRVPLALSLPGNEMVLANASTMLRFAVRPGSVRLLSVRNLVTGYEYLRHVAGGLWKLTFKNVGDRERIELSPGDAASRSFRIQRAADAAAIQFLWRQVGHGGTAVRLVTATVTAKPDAIGWGLSFDGCEAAAGLWEVEFPILGAIGRAGGGDALIVPRKWGRVLPDAGLGGRYESRYPRGNCNMQFFAYTTGRSGLYFAAHDPEARTKDFGAVPDPTGGLRFSITIHPENMGRRREHWRAPFEVVLQAFEGDWFDAAKKYRTWAVKQKWCAPGALWKRGEAERRFARLALNYRPTFPEQAAAVLRMDAALEVPAFVHVYSWHRIPFDNNYPEYFPAKAAFSGFVRQLHARGLAVMPYINGRLWDTDTDSWRREKGIRAAVKNEDGGLYIEHWARQKHAVMCPWTAKWREKICDIVEKAARDLGCDGMYIDQVAASTPRLCFDRSHGHPSGGGGWWVDGYRQLFKEAKARARRFKPGFFITSEDNAEPYMGALDGYLMRCAYPETVGRRTIPLFAAVYGGYAVMFAHGWGYRDPRSWLIDSARMLVWGAQLGSVSNDVLLEQGNRRALEFTRQLLRVRLAATKWLAFGEMRRPPQLQGEIPSVRYGRNGNAEIDAVQAAVWRSPEGESAALIFVNASDTQPVEFTWRLDARECGLPPASMYRLRASVPRDVRHEMPAGPVLRSRLRLAPWTAAVFVVEPVR